VGALSGIGKRYAVALFNAAVAEDVLDQVHDDLASFARLAETEAAFRIFLASQRVSAEEKRDLVVHAIGQRASGLFVQFVLLLIEKKRIDEFADSAFADIVQSFERLYEAHTGLIRVGVVTAVALDVELERKAKSTIERRTGKTARIEKRIDPHIIGGMIMIADGQIIDGSIRSQLAELRQQLLEAREN
jgi:F-type H+-transporting ATPase subunit delta